MDIELARTFLEIAAAGTLVKAAERLHVTQATVSARLQNLETELDARLFVRNKAGTRLTAAGEAFVPFATQLVQVWSQATRAVATPLTEPATLSVGGEFSLWSAVLLNWLVALRKDRHDVVLRAHVDGPTGLLDCVQQGRLDIALLYSPLRRPGVVNALVLEEELVAVSTEPEQQTLRADNYVYVDWGPDFAAQHNRVHPELASTRTQIGLGPLALRFLLKAGGAGYFRTRAIDRHCVEGHLHRIPGVPTFSYSLYAAYSERADPTLIDWARERLVAAASEPIDGWA
jgi:LysR family transcriptional regulator, flagellar master operon regulator